LLLAVSATCQWQLPAVSAADNEANNTAAVATGGVNNSASGVYSSVVGGLRNEASNTAAVAVGGVRNSASGNYLLLAAQIMRPTILPRLLLAVSATLPVVYSSRSAVCAMKPPSPQLPLAVSATCQWQLPAVFGGADNEANNTAAVATGGVINLPVVCTHPWSAASMKPPILPQWLLAVSATLPVAITLLFSAAQIMSQHCRVVTLAVSITLPVVCTHPWSAACARSHQYCRSGCWVVSATLPVITLVVAAAAIVNIRHHATVICLVSHILLGSGHRINHACQLCSRPENPFSFLR
jgi:uncharacterized membrane protein YhaH (DUF805 family)